ncbi:MAG TPA: hypothetical protein VK926_01580 [Gaiellaceae bacterium]|nr:hypothetical protein [Gaiellaceae bacterium]
MKVAVATCAALPPGFADDRLLIAALETRAVQAEHVVWDDDGARWDGFDLVVIRSTWDYPHKRAAFLDWADSLDGRLRNSPSVVRWNSDKHYLADLAAIGLPVVPTDFVGPGDAIPAFEGEVVVKPAISAGARDTGRFGPKTHDSARARVARLQAEGRVAMVQPYLRSVDSRGETMLAFIAGRFSHALRKRAVLRPDEEAPVRADALGAAEAMYEADLVEPAEATAAELEAANAVVAYLAELFGDVPLYARVDMVDDVRGEPLLLELEAVEPSLYLGFSPGAADRLADAIQSG